MTDFASMSVDRQEPLSNAGMKRHQSQTTVGDQRLKQVGYTVNLKV